MLEKQNPNIDEYYLPRYYIIDFIKFQQNSTKEWFLTTFERCQSLRNLLRKQVGSRGSELVELKMWLKAQFATILNTLSEEGCLKRVHGGAVKFNQVLG